MSHWQLCFLMPKEISAVKKAYCYRAFKEHRQNQILFQITKFIICYIQAKKKDKTNWIHCRSTISWTICSCVKCPCWGGGIVQRRSAENHFTLGTFLFTLESLLPVFLFSLLGDFFPFLPAAGLGAFSSCFFLDGFYSKETIKGPRFI